mgnify:CR=1 FL=1
MTDNEDREFAQSIVLGLLNEAHGMDPTAIESIMDNRVNVSWAVANHPHIVVGGTEQNPHLGSLGLINGILSALGIPLVAIEYDQDHLDEILRFVPYVKPKPISSN